MPIYAYQAIKDSESCDYCRNGFEIMQSIKEDRLTACPKCGSSIHRLLYAVGIATPHTNTELKNLGFTKLVKRDDGVYENVTKTDKETRYMERDKPETIPDIKSKISD